jgi:hypothetical protein
MAFGNQSAVPASTSAAKTVTFTNAGSSPVDVTAVYLAGANPGDYTITAGDVAQTLAPGASKTVSVTFSPKAVGARSATLNFMSNGANTAYQTINLTGNGVGAAAPSTPGRPTIVFGTDPLGTSTAPVKVSWTASTGTLTHYQLQRATGTGVFADTTPQPSTATTITQQVAAGSYRYQVRACNGTNCSAWTTATSITLGAVQESSANLQYGGTWSGNVAVSGAFGGNVRNSSTAQANVRYNFTASTIQFISTKGPNRGNVQIIIGGQTTTVNLYAATEQPRQVVFSRTGLPTNSQTTIEVRVPGTRTAPSTANRVDVDAFVTLR